MANMSSNSLARYNSNSASPNRRKSGNNLSTGRNITNTSGEMSISNNSVGSSVGGGGGGGSGSGYGSSRRSGLYTTENEEELSELFESISKVAALAANIAGSSLLFFVAFNIAQNTDGWKALLHLYQSVDCTVNMVCLILAFEFAKSWFKVICGCYRDCCVKCIKRKVGLID